MCDVQLLQRCGPDAISRLWHELGDMPVMFVTSMPADCNAVDHAIAVLIKPVSGQQLAATFHHHAALLPPT